MPAAFQTPLQVFGHVVTLQRTDCTNYATCRRARPTCCERAKQDKRVKQGKGAESSKAPRDAPKRRRIMSPEARAKISAALKGRRKSEEHRENLRRRFEGDQNPMYGRKLSAESRAKISRAMMARNQKKAEESGKKRLDKSLLEGLREKAKSSRLLESRKEGRKRPGRQVIDEREAKEIDKILERVARLDEPPENVVKTIRNNEKKREVKLGERGKRNKANEKDKKDVRMKCKMCKGSGMVSCAECVGAFGVISTRCETCFGAGATFCGDCEGAGTI